MEGISFWLNDNKEWLFSGVGLMVIATIIRLLYKRRQISSSQTIRSGNSSTNVQAGQDAYVGTKKKDLDVEER